MQWERIADANLNRLNESLKLIEDISRFTIKDNIILAQIRRLRQVFLSVKKVLPLKSIIDARDSCRDPGKKGSFDSHEKKDISDITIANFTRAMESSRVLEECLKYEYPKLSRKVKQIRFGLYGIEKSVVAYFEKLFDPSIYVVLDGTLVKKYQIRRVMETLLNNGASMIQLRIKSQNDRIFFNYARTMRSILKTKNVKFIINNRMDIALACSADGVHLGQEDMPISTARRVMGSTSIIGVSVHNIADARKAEKDGADYLGVGSIFKTTTKLDARVCGLRRLQAICRVISIPVIGIGGITSSNYRSVLKAGASGIALASYLFQGDLKKNLRSLTPRK